MFFDMTNMSGGYLIRIIHKVAAIFFIAPPLVFSIIDPRAAISFLKESFQWKRENFEWLKHSFKFYSGSNIQMPPQGYLNGDQKAWQLVVVLTGFVLTFSGLALWWFKLKMPWMLYQGILLTHAAAFIVVSISFLVHLYLTTLHPRLEESLSSMIDGKVSHAYAQKHYTKWYESKTQKEKLKE